jgi:hypothetical protein
MQWKIKKVWKYIFSQCVCVCVCVCMYVCLSRVDPYWVTVANKHVSTATNQHATIEKLLEMVSFTVVWAEEL